MIVELTENEALVIATHLRYGAVRCESNETRLQFLKLIEKFTPPKQENNKT